MKPYMHPYEITYAELREAKEAKRQNYMAWSVAIILGITIGAVLLHYLI